MDPGHWYVQYCQNTHSENNGEGPISGKPDRTKITYCHQKGGNGAYGQTTYSGKIYKNPMSGKKRRERRTYGHKKNDKHKWKSTNTYGGGKGQGPISGITKKAYGHEGNNNGAYDKTTYGGGKPEHPISGKTNT
eukprot:3032254-Heterocapsa_arctica.AAC.1